MVLNACINPGYLGNFNITPDRIIVSGEQNTNLSIKEILEKILKEIENENDNNRILNKKS